MTEFPEILRGYSGLNIGLIFCGISFLITGLLLSQPIFYTIGGTLFGASLGAFFGRIANIDLNQKTIELNQKTNELYVKLIDTLNTLETQKFISDELSVKAFRRIWHLYHITMIDGNYYWRHTLCDFSQSVLPGCLYAIANVLDPKGNPMTYCVEAGVRGDRLFIIETDSRRKRTPDSFYISLNRSGIYKKLLWSGPHHDLGQNPVNKPHHLIKGANFWRGRNN